MTKRVKTKSPPRDRMVLRGTVKLTPRRREILFAIYNDSLSWMLVKNFAYYRRGERISHLPLRWDPVFGEQSAYQIVSYLTKHKLARYSREAPHPSWGNQIKTIILITPRGIAALLECVPPVNERNSNDHHQN